MTWKHEYIFLKYHWNLNISEILQGLLQVNNIQELLLKYHFHMFMTSSILVRLKSWSARGASHHSVFMGSSLLLVRWLFSVFCLFSLFCLFSPCYPVDEFSFKEMRTWGWSTITSFCIWNRRNRRVIFKMKFKWNEIDRVALRILLNINNRVPLQKQPTALTCWLFP